MLVLNCVPIYSVEFICLAVSNGDAELIYTDQRKQHLKGGLLHAAVYSNRDPFFCDVDTK